MIVKITEDNFEAEVVNSDKPVLLDFGATWCIPCKRVVKIVEELDAEQDAVKMAKIDIEECPKIAAKHGIVNIPVLIYYKDGKEAGRLAGVKPKKAVLDLINK